jgi:hypothetical protein
MSLAAATRSETTKQFTTAGWWILLLVLFVYVGFTALALGWVLAASATGALPGEQAPQVPAEVIPPLLYSLAASVGYVFPLLVGTLMVTGEFRHQTLTPTFHATPRRGVVLWAKVLVGILLGVIFAIVGLLSSVGPGAAFLSGFGLDTAFGSSDTWALFGRVVIALVLWALVGIGVGALVRNQVAAIVIVLAFTQFVEPIARFAATLVDGLGTVTQYLPGAASDALVGASVFTAMGAPTGDAAQLEWWVGGLVLAGYAVVLLVLGHLLSWRRDVS